MDQSGWDGAGRTGGRERERMVSFSFGLGFREDLVEAAWDGAGYG